MRLSNCKRVIPAVIMAVTILAYVLGGSGVAIATLVVSLVPLAWVFDNRSGAFLILAILFVITSGIMVLLIALMALRT